MNYEPQSFNQHQEMSYLRPSIYRSTAWSGNDSTISPTTLFHPSVSKPSTYAPANMACYLSDLKPASTPFRSDDRRSPSARCPGHLAVDSCNHNNIVTKPEDDAMRDRRFFGGDEEDEGNTDDLRGAMLDVVLGLFDGVDYED